jgi:uncharacterized protein YcbX
MSVGIVKEIYIYPVKSLSGIKLDKCLVTKYGIAHPECPNFSDRFFLVKIKINLFIFINF